MIKRKKTLPLPPHQRIRKGERGVTIIEWLTAMSILLIATTAVIGMQSTTLQAHKISDDVIVANNLALQASEILQADALRWKVNIGNTTYFPLAGLSSWRMQGNNQIGNKIWHTLTPAPVNFQWSSNQDQLNIAYNGSTAQEHQRTYYRNNYCIFYMYRWSGSDSPLIAKEGLSAPVFHGQDELLEVILVVSWPFSTNGLTVPQRAFHSTCGSTTGTFQNTADNQNFIDSNPNLPDANFRQVRHTFYIRRDMLGGQ